VLAAIVSAASTSRRATSVEIPAIEPLPWNMSKRTTSRYIHGKVPKITPWFWATKIIMTPADFPALRQSRASRPLAQNRHRRPYRTGRC